MRAADAGLGDLDHAGRGCAATTRAKVDAVDLEGLEVAGVDADDPGAGVDGPVDLLLVVHLDQRGQAEGLGALDAAPTRAGWSRAATMSRTRSAPSARASHTW